MDADQAASNVQPNHIHQPLNSKVIVPTPYNLHLFNDAQSNRVHSAKPSVQSSNAIRSNLNQTSKPAISNGDPNEDKNRQLNGHQNGQNSSNTQSLNSSQISSLSSVDGSVRNASSVSEVNSSSSANNGLVSCNDTNSSNNQIQNQPNSQPNQPNNQIDSRPSNEPTKSDDLNQPNSSSNKLVNEHDSSSDNLSDITTVSASDLFPNIIFDLKELFRLSVKFTRGKDIRCF